MTFSSWMYGVFQSKYKKEIIKATKEFRNQVFFYTLLAGTTRFVRNYVDLNNRHAPEEFSTFLLKSLDGGIELAAFPFVNSIMMATFQPKIRTIGQWIPWTIQNVIIANGLYELIKVPILNYYASGNISMDGYFANLFPRTMKDSAFQVTTGLASKYLPPESKMGGKFARSTAVFTLGNLSSVLVFSDVYRFTFRQFAAYLSRAIPDLMFDNALLTILSNGQTSLFNQFLGPDF